MANFNFIDSAAKGYLFLADELPVILRLALLPFVIKLISYVGITSLDLTDNYLRQGWILAPSYLAEGWLVCTLVRHALFAGQDVQPSRNIILAGALVYVLIKLVFSFVVGGALSFANVSVETIESMEYSPEPSVITFIVGVAMVMASIWCFRLLWLHIPIVMGIPIKTFLHKIRGFSSSITMMGLWMMSMVPLALSFLLLVDFLYFLMPGDGETPSMMYQFLFIIAQSAVEIAIAVVSTMAMTYGIRHAMSGDKS